MKRVFASCIAVLLAVTMSACGSDPATAPSSSTSARAHDVLPRSCAEWQSLNVGERYDAIHTYLNRTKILSKNRDRAQDSDTVAQAINQGCYNDPPENPRDSADDISAAW